MTNLVRPSQRAFGKALLDPDQPVPADIQVWDGSDPARRFAVYRNNVVSSLVDALAATFPVVQELVGEEFFRAMSAVYVRSNPPGLPVLASYGHSFADFVEEFEPARNVPYLADVARLEYARMASFHSADAVALREVDSDLAGLGDVGQLVFQVHPSVRVLAFTHSAVSVWAAHNGFGRLEEVEVDVPEFALVSRVDFEVEVVRLQLGAAALIQELIAGEPLGAAVEFGREVDSAVDIAAALSVLVRQQGVISIKVPRSQLQ
jgi:hypothetical protein